MEIKRIQTPLDDSAIEKLKAGEKVFLNGFIFTARDSAHKRFFEALDKGEELPFDMRNQIIYYCGPSPAPPGKAIGSCGPTTSGRMDAYAPRLIALGLKGMIGKGKRSQAVKDSLKQHKAVYFGATGGAGALLAKCIVSSEIVAYEDLGPEGVVKLGVKDLPLFVINDMYGNDLYEAGIGKYRR
ncbi:MAG TPA: Fe-S-containing hydro-lyase [Syntrophorhabdaceae bacterium]|nr:Fe-S-containing hydro-lyase [Syntrophorhabdaceae bacterium]HQM80454.1 Fe-S-containing hydro-lyase [Syntrophorhabdaceae bacterium]